MQTSISKRLLAGLLSIVMVLSLFAATPAKSEAASTANNYARIDLETVKADGAHDHDGFVVGDMTARIRACELVIGKELYTTSVEFAPVVINNGTYNLDPEELIKEKVQYAVTVAVKFDKDDAAAFNALTGAQILVGPDFSGSETTDYVAATVKIEGNVAYFTAKTKSIDEVIKGTDIESLAQLVRLAPGEAVPASLLSFKNVCFTQGRVVWKNAKNVEVTKVAAAGTSYSAEVVLSAKDGYRFADYTEGHELEANTANGRHIKVTMSAAEKKAGYKTCKVVITKVVAEGADDEVLPITKLVLPQNINFGTNDIATLHSAMQAVYGLTAQVEVGGQMVTVGTHPDGWKFYASDCTTEILATSGNATLPQLQTADYTGADDTAKRNNAIVGLNGNCIWAVYPITVPYTYDYYGLGDMRCDLNYLISADADSNYLNSGLECPDTYGLFGLYAGTSATLNKFNANAQAKIAAGYWVVRITQNAAETDAKTETKTEVKAINVPSAPVVTFGNDRNDKVYIDVATEETAVAYFDEDADAVPATAMDQNRSGAFKDGLDATKAYTVAASTDLIYSSRNGFEALEAPAVVAYFKKGASVTNAKEGVVDLWITDPEAGEVPEYTLVAAKGTIDMADAFDYTLANILVDWDGELHTDNAGVQKFQAGHEYTATILVPVKSHKTVKTVPAVTVNGTKIEKPELIELYGKQYLKVTYAASLAATYDVKATACKKPIWTDMQIPYAGSAVQRTINPTQSSSRYYKFEKVTWYENGMEFTGSTFALGKRYTAVVTFDCSEFTIGADCTNAALVVGAKKLDAKKAADYAVTSAKITKEDKKCVLTYEFDAVSAAKITGVNDLTINAPNKIDDLPAYVENQLFFVANCEGGTTTVLDINSMAIPYKYKTVYGGAPDFGTAMNENYPGVLGYDKTKDEAQHFEFVVIMEYAGSKYTANLKVNVAGVKANVTFDANGGTYLGSNIVVEKGTAYGFKYVKSEIFRAGYFFAGWYDAAEGGNRIYSTTILKDKTTLYAHWAKVFTGMVKNFTAVSYSAGRLTVTASKPVTAVNGYEFSYSKDGVNWTTVRQAKNVKYFIGLEKGTYSVRVRAYRLDSAGNMVFGAYSKVVKATVK